MAALDTSIYLTPPYSVWTGPFGTTASGTAPGSGVFTGLATFPFPVEILGFSMNRGGNSAPDAGVTFTCGHNVAGAAHAGGFVACGEAFTDVAAIGTQNHIINDNGITGTDPRAGRPFVVPAGRTIGFRSSSGTMTNSVFNGFTILYRPAK